MPYADPDKQRAAQAEWYRKKYQGDPKFVKAEAERKADWLRTPEGAQSNRLASKRAREANHEK